MGGGFLRGLNNLGAVGVALQAGDIVEAGPADELFRAPRTEYAKTLLAAALVPAVPFATIAALPAMVLAVMSKVPETKTR
jgi:ABC-type dipeptide/oligopeptide/nickel transport system ATPase component